MEANESSTFVNENSTFANETTTPYETYRNYTEYDCMDNMGESFRHTLYFQTAVTFVYFALFCVTLFGNGAVCFIVSANPRMRTVTNYFIANLALGDMLMSVFCGPFSFVSSLILYYWPFGGVMCRLVNYFQVVSVLVTAYTLVALAADRYRAITAPLRPRLSKPEAKVAITAVWVGAMSTAVPTPLFSDLTYPTDLHEFCHKSICKEIWPTPKQEHFYSMALMTLQFAIPLSVLVFTYAKIAKAVWGGRPPGEAENSRDKIRAKSKRKMVKMMIVVVVVFTICWLPYNALLLLYNDTWQDWWLLPYLWFVFHWLAMSHSCYNPIIYWYMNARFRAGFLQVLGKIPCCRKYAKARLTLSDGVNRSSLAGNIPMTGMESSDNMLFRMNTNSTYVSVRRGPGHMGGRNNVDPISNSTLTRARYGDTMLNNRI